ncbi:F0F1 ATP synthase subunit B [Anaerobium acetethylicum]|uniref:ATP synthase subunit b n=1 Tax=Anaerobium acetethylicum TaxID=1619234 RepID=A0A1D3TTH5_9FIRM|nr:F0F1 ATP synthase subunit B [Anaerobium acetethylicum]SCP97224.1 F-type H+-transporting ATPase subunit b [Anaerobium acetethylicum]
MLKLDWWNLVLNMINVLVLYLLMRKFLFGPVTEIMEKRKNAIEASLAEADEKNNEALKLKQDYEKALEDADEKATAIVKEAKQRALGEHDKQINATQKEISEMMESAKKSIELEKQKSMQDIQLEIAGVAMAAAAKVIRKNVDDSTNKKIIDDFLAEEGAGR